MLVPRGAEHRTSAEEDAYVLCFEPAGTVNTGNLPPNEFTARAGDRGAHSRLVSVTAMSLAYSSAGSPTVMVRCIFHDPSGWRCRMRISLPPPENTSPDARARELDRTVPHWNA